MPHADFVHLRVHSAYSLSEGALKIPDLVKLCQDMDMPAVAIADTGNLFGALEFSTACAGAGVQPIVGCQLALAAKQRDIASNTALQVDQIVLLVKDRAGYDNLLKLVSHSYLGVPAGDPAHVTIDDLAAMNEGLIVLTGGPAGPIGRLLQEGQHPAADEALATLAGLFADRLYVEVMRHGLAAEDGIEDDLIALAYRHDLPLVATNEAFFATPDMFEAHDALICIAESAYVAQEERRRLTPQHWFKPATDMRALFADLPEAVDNTLTIARRCAYRPEPLQPILPPFSAGEPGDEIAILRRQAGEGLGRRLADHVYSEDMDQAARDAAAKPYLERLEYELGVIADMGYPGYFLIVADFIRWAKEHDIPVGPGRGSGAGSAVAWALTITDLDPLRFGLIFERFLNPERISMPDFDVDFCQEKRDEVIRYVQGKYGEDRVAQIITFGKLQARAVLRDVGRVLQLPYPQVDRICKLVPNNPANPVTLQQAINGEPELQDTRDSEPAVARLIDIALRLEGLYRHASTHAAGVVIGDRPLDELVPLYRDPRSDMPVTQFNMIDVERAGLVKFDFLGLKTLTVLAQTRDLLRARGVEIDLSSLPLDNAATFEMLSRGDSTGVFQLEGSGMRDVLRQLRPDRFEDIIALVALYRPGPMENIPSYISRKHGKEQIDYLHPTLEAILNETYGIMIYQEQVIQVAQTLAGYSRGQADILRKAMGKKIKSEMDAQRQNFVEGAVEREVNREQASLIFDQAAKFAGYGFNKSHAAAYAMVAYQTAYLKANYPVEFMAASMTLDLGNTDKLNVFRQELDRLSIELLAPNVNRSRAVFAVEYDAGGQGAIRYALAALKNVGRQAMQALVNEREANGPFTSLFEFSRRMDTRVINRRQLENLVFAGTFDVLDENRARVHAAIDAMIQHANAAAGERDSAQANLFGDLADGGAAAEPALPAVPKWPLHERLAREYEAIGSYLSAHPLDAYRHDLKRLGVISSSELEARLNRGNGGRILLAGTVVGKRERTSSRGSRYAFVQMSDTAGMYELTVFSEVLAAASDVFESGGPLLIEADGRIDADRARITAISIKRLDAAAESGIAALKVYLDTADPLPTLASVISREEGKGRGRIELVLALDGAREVEMELPRAYAVSPAVRAAIKAVPGVIDVEAVA